MSRRGHGEGSIFRRQDGRWVARLDLGYQAGKRQRKEFYGRTRRAVQEQLTAALRDHQQGLPVATDRQTVARYLDRWLQDTARPTVRPSTFDSYERLVRLHIVPSIGRRQLSKLTPQDLSGLYAASLAKGLAPRSVQFIHAILHRALDQAVRWNLLARNPAALVDPPRPRRPESVPLTPEQCGLFLTEVRGDRLAALYVLALTTGMRLGELLGLKWGDLDWQTAELHVHRQLGRSSAGLTFSEPKTVKGRRTIALPRLAMEALRAHRAAQLEERLLAGAAWQDQDLVFANTIGRPIERQNLVRRSFKPLLRRAGLPDIRFHDLRHSAATLLLSLGEHPKVVQERLGHATIAVTMDIYSHLMPQLQRQAAEKLDRLFASG